MQRTTDHPILLFCLLALMAVLTPLCVAAQIDINGQVTDTKGQPLPGANVYILGTYDGASSDAEGFFSFTTAEADTATLRVEFIGYAPTSMDLGILAADRSDVLISLHEVFNQLKAVTISGSGFEASDSKRAVALKPLDIVTTAGAAGDIAGALQTLPGTTTVGESGRLFVRGGSASETQTYIDGMLVQEPYTRTPANVAVRGRFNPFIFSGTVFNTGGYSAEYGQALSSVLLLETKDTDLQDEWNVSLMSVGADMARTKVWDKGSVTTTLGYTDLTPYMSVVPQNFDYERLPMALNGALSLRQQTSQTGLLKVYGNYTATRYDVYDEVPAQEQAVRVDGGDDNAYVNLSWREIIADKWSLKTGLSYSHTNENVRYGSSSIDETSTGWHAKVMATHDLSDKVDIRLGAEQFSRAHSTSLGTDETAVYDRSTQRSALFVETDLFVTNDLAFKAGGRMEHAPATDLTAANTTLSPRLTAALRTGEQSQLTAAFGRFYQEVDAPYVYGGRDLQEEHAQHYILSYQYTGKARTLRAELYHKEYEGLAKTDLTASDYRVDNSGYGHARGIDLWWRDRETIDNGDYWLSYSYLDSERDFRDYPQAATPGFVAAHSFSAVYKHWVQDWRSMIGGTFSYTSPRHYDDPNRASFLSEKMDPLAQVNLNWAYLHRENVIFYAAVSNVLGQEQQFGYEYAPTPDTDGVYASSPILPAADRFFFVGCFITWSKSATNQLDKIQ